MLRRIETPSPAGMQIGLVWSAVGRGRVFPFANQRRIAGRFARGPRCCCLQRRSRSTVGRHQNVGVPHVESPARFRTAANERFAEDNAVVCSMTPHEGPFSPEWSLGVWGWASVASCFVPAESRALPSPLIFLSALFSKTNSMRASFDQERERRAKARRFQSEEDRSLALLGSRIPRHMRLFTG